MTNKTQRQDTQTATWTLGIPGRLEMANCWQSITDYTEYNRVIEITVGTLIVWCVFW